ncbi:hypothetical protein NQZ68_040546 [Dissostichus eleginoides]|nr:hypothetical protein NQZ68_040546 [Dissostichus eleginoides]
MGSDKMDGSCSRWPSSKAATSKNFITASHTHCSQGRRVVLDLAVPLLSADPVVVEMSQSPAVLEDLLRSPSQKLPVTHRAPESRNMCPLQRDSHSLTVSTGQ